MYTKGDFHSHTTASDGKFSPKHLVSMAKKEGIDIMSITDHDTIAGVNEGIDYGTDIGVKVIPGIELSTLYNNSNVHLLGYFKDESKISNSFKDYLSDIETSRINRGKLIIDKLYNKFNIKIDYEKILKDANGIIARPHIANAIIEAGYNHSWEYIFKNLIGDGCGAYVANKKISTREGINLLKNEDALVVLAHPILIKNIKLEELLTLPFDGIEAIYSLNFKKDTNYLISLARKHNKIITAGSDFHGITKEDTKHASKIGEVYLTGADLEKFLNKVL